VQGAYEIAIWAFDGVRNRAISWHQDYTIQD